MGLRIGECRVAILALLHVPPVVSFGSSVATTFVWQAEAGGSGSRYILIAFAMLQPPRSDCVCGRRARFQPLRCDGACGVAATTL